MMVVMLAMMVLNVVQGRFYNLWSKGRIRRLYSENPSMEAQCLSAINIY